MDSMWSCGCENVIEDTLLRSQKRVYRGTLLGSRVVIFDLDDARSLYAEGFYGKPIGISKPKGPSFDSPLELDLIEAVYLVRRGLLVVEDSEGRVLTPDELESIAARFVPRFHLLYRVYSELRDAGYVVRSGLKFGTDFAVYVHGPGIDHAPFLVSVVEYHNTIDPLEIVRAGRLSHSVRKHFVIAAVNVKTGSVTYLGFSWVKL